MDPRLYKDHPVFSDIKLWERLLRTKAAKDNIDAEKITYLTTAVNFIRDKIKTSITILIPDELLDNCAMDLSNAYERIDKYIINNTSPAQYDKAKSLLDKTIKNLYSLPSYLPNENFNFTQYINEIESLAFEKSKIAKHAHTYYNTKLKEIEKKLKSIDQLSKTTIERINQQHQDIIKQIQSTTSTDKVDIEEDFLPSLLEKINVNNQKTVMHLVHKHKKTNELYSDKHYCAALKELHDFIKTLFEHIYTSNKEKIDTWAKKNDDLAKNTSVFIKTAQFFKSEKTIIKSTYADIEAFHHTRNEENHELSNEKESACKRRIDAMYEAIRRISDNYNKIQKQQTD